MSSLTTLTGRNGEIVIGSTRVPRMTQWEVNPKLATKSEWGDSDSAGFTNRASGRKDATFTVEGKYDTETEIFDFMYPELIVAAILWMGDVAGLAWHFPRALCEDFSLLVNVDTEEVVGWSGDLGADGVFYRPGEAGASVGTYPG